MKIFTDAIMIGFTRNSEVLNKAIIIKIRCSLLYPTIIVLIYIFEMQWLAYWIETPPCVREVMGSIPVGDSDDFFVTHNSQFTFRK